MDNIMKKFYSTNQPLSLPKPTAFINRKKILK